MNEKRYANLALILALAALALSTLIYSIHFAAMLIPVFYFFMQLIGMPILISGDLLNGILLEPIYLTFWGWIPALALSLIAFRVSSRLKSRSLKLVIWLILSVSAISALFWATFALGFTYGYRYN